MAGRRGACRRLPSAAAAWKQGENGEGGEGILIPCSPRAIAHGGGGSTGEKGRGGGARGAAARWCLGKREGGAVKL
jgi:hypothetical protein